jgi:hypothetical protein
MKNPCLEAALGELAKVGIRDVTRSYGGKHLQIRWRSANGAARVYSLPLTPSDFRSASNTRADIRRILREDGLLITAERKPPTPKPPDRITLLERRVAALEQLFNNIFDPNRQQTSQQFTSSSANNGR